MQKAISVIIPAYNAEKYISDCLSSLSKQTFTNFEIIISNDGSSDRTLERINEFKSIYQDIDIKVISNPNGGVSLARKRALEKATGEWITFVDADDTIPPNSLMDLYSSTSDNSDLVVGFLIPKQDLISDFIMPSQWQSAILRGIIPPNLCGKLYRREILKPSMLDIPKDIINGEDTLVNLKYAFEMNRPPVFCLSKIYNYTRNPLSLSHSACRDVEYEYKYDQLRLSAIPKSKHDEYLPVITKSRFNGLLGCCRVDPYTIANKTHPFFNVISQDIQNCQYHLSPYEWVVMNVKSPTAIRLTGLVRSMFISLRYRISLIFNK